VLQDTLFFLRQHTDFFHVAHRSNLINVLTLNYELTAAITFFQKFKTSFYSTASTTACFVSVLLIGQQAIRQPITSAVTGSSL